MHYFGKANRTNHGVRLAKQHGMDAELLELALKVCLSWKAHQNEGLTAAAIAVLLLLLLLVRIQVAGKTGCGCYCCLSKPMSVIRLLAAATGCSQPWHTKSSLLMLQ